MIDFWILKDDCTACGACENICPKSAIKIVSDNYGFSYPEISANKCIDCGLCAQVCPIKNKYKKENIESEIYSAWSKNKDIRYNSTSGGMFSEIALEVIKNGGSVIGALYDSDNMIRHDVIEDEKGLEKIRQSKYAQSDIGLIFIEIKKLLDKGKRVAFCGAPCQVAGLNSFLDKDYKNLLTIDFICRGVNSPKAYKAWLNQRESDYQAKATKVWFKYKQFGWKNSPRCTRVDFNNGEVYVANGKQNTFMSGYLGPNLYIRPSCGNCHFKGIQRQSDITLADFWGIKKEYDDDLGTSLVMLNSNKGTSVFNKIKGKIVFEPQNMSSIFAGNVCIDNSVEINPKSKAFLKSLDDNPFDAMVLKYSTVPLYKSIINKGKRLLQKTLVSIRKAI